MSNPHGSSAFTGCFREESYQEQGEVEATGQQGEAPVAHRGVYENCAWMVQVSSQHTLAFLSFSFSTLKPNFIVRTPEGILLSLLTQEVHPGRDQVLPQAQPRQAT